MNVLTMYAGRKIVEGMGNKNRYAFLAAGSALLFYGLRKRSVGGYLLALAGGDLIYRGASNNGHLYDLFRRKNAEELPYGRGVKVQESIVVNKPAAQLYEFWRNLQNLPLFMSHIESVETHGSKESHWKVRGPLGRTVEWDAEVIADTPNEMIGWRSLEGSQVDHAGSVRFEPSSSGTEVIVSLQYNPPAGIGGAVASKLLGANPRRHIRQELRRFKRLMEAADVPVLQSLLQKRA